MSNADAVGTAAGKPAGGRPTQSGLTRACDRVPARRDRAGLVRRARLLDRLSAVADNVALILVAAPAGYGKTTALGQWAAADKRGFAWVHLTEMDDDPWRLLGRLAGTLGRIAPSPDPAGSVPLDLALSRLLSAARTECPFDVLVVDDAHWLRSGPALDLLVAFADGLPVGRVLVVSSRARPALTLGRLRSEGRCVEFGPGALVLDPDEVRAVLSGMGVDAPDPAVQALMRRTEGWPVGVYLAALSLVGRPDVTAAVAEITGHDRYLMEYFRDEVLGHESPETVRSLQRTAVLARMSGALCDEVLASTGSAAWLAEIHSRSLFVSRQDPHDEWYRYHPLFAEALLSRLRRQDPGSEGELRRRAAGWLEKHRLPEQAIAQAIVGRDTPTAARLVSTCGPGFVNAGQLGAVREWLTALEGVQESHPQLALTGGWVAALSGNPAGARRLLLAAERGSADEPPLDGSASHVSGVAMLRAALAPYGIDHMLADAQQAFDLEPQGGLWHPLAAALLGIGYLLSGDSVAAAIALERAAYLGCEQQPAAAGLALAQLSLLAAEQDDWFTAAAYASESWGVLSAANLPDGLFTLLTYVAAGRVAGHRGDELASRRNIANASRLYAQPSPVAFPWLAAQSAIGLGRIMLEVGDFADAGNRLAEARRHLARLPTAGILHEQRRRLASDIEARRGGITMYGEIVLTAAELRVLRSLRTHLTLGEIAEDLRISRNTVKSQVAAVYRKLQASTRTEAVRSGRILGLLD